MCGRDHGVNVGNVFLQVGAGTWSAEKFTTVRTSGRFWGEEPDSQITEQENRGTGDRNEVRCARVRMVAKMEEENKLEKPCLRRL